jgi:hypothetical protein
MMEAWGIEGNPFPSEAIHRGDEPYNPDVFPEENEQFFKKLVYGALMDGRGFSFLWSKGVNNEDTGYGKTTLLRHGAQEINKDFGQTVLRDVGMKRDRIEGNLAVASYASLNTLSAAGVYPILFGATEYLADPKSGLGGRSVFGLLRKRIVEANALDEDDEEGVQSAVLKARRKLGTTLVPLNEEALRAFRSTDEADIADFLAEVKDTTRVRSGLAYFDFAVTVAAAAGVRHFFVFVDQLEDLATTPTVTKAKRSREVGRLRDIIAETPHFAGKVRFVFTFHARAADALDEMWRLNRLPSYDPEDRANEGSVVVLRGIQTVDQARELLVTYLNTRRTEGERDDISPFKENILPILIERSGGRPGILLQFAYRLFDRAADQGLATIDREFAATILGTKKGANTRGALFASVPDPSDARDIDDLLK